MNILSVDTTTKNASVALKINNKIHTKNVENEITHSEKLLPLIDEILKNNSINVNDIDLYTVINGPGSFTGVRIGLATIKAFSMVNNIPIFSISSLEAMAISLYNKLSLENEAYILSLIDAKNQRAYYGLYKLNKENDKVHIEEILQSNNELIDNILDTVKETIANNNISNNIIIACNNLKNFNENIDNKIISLKMYDIYPTSEDLILIYESIYNSNKYIFNTYTLDAVYVRPSQAERIKNEQKNK